jgi:hypothetical protein
MSKVRVKDPKLAKIIKEGAAPKGVPIEIDDGKGSLDPETFRTEVPETLPEPLKRLSAPKPTITTPKPDLEAWSSLAESVCKPLEDTLSVSEMKVYRAVLIPSLAYAHMRGYSGALNLVTWFMPVELLCLWFEIPRRTFYAGLSRLKQLNLVHYRAHRCKAGWINPKRPSETWSDGTVFCVKTNPLSDCEPRVRFDWLKRVYRNLSTDIRENRTVWALKQRLHSQKDGLKALLKFDEFLAWSETPDQRAKFQESMTVQDDRSAYSRLFYLPSIEKPLRSVEIESLGLWMAAKLRDSDKHKYFKLLWNGLRMADRGLQDALLAIQNALQRVLQDADWSKIRSGGALFVTRLKETGWYDEICREPQTRVGVMP